MHFGKVWGDTMDIFANDVVQISRITANKGGYCSKHKHHERYNLFYVETGRLKIKVWKKAYDLVDETILGPGESTTVAPGEYHIFEALEDTVAFEVYYCKVRDNDIERETVGGG